MYGSRSSRNGACYDQIRASKQPATFWAACLERLAALLEREVTKMQDSPAVKISLAHIDARSHHDWDTMRAFLAPAVHAVVTTTHPNFRCSEFSGVDTYMQRKVKGAQLVEPGSVRIISTIGDASNAMILMTMRIGLGSNEKMVTMARACLATLDEFEKIKGESDQFFVLSE